MNTGSRIVLVLISALTACSPLAALVHLGISRGLHCVPGIRNNVTMRRLAGLVALAVLWLASLVTVLPPADERPDPSEEISRVERELDFVFRDTREPDSFSF